MDQRLDMWTFFFSFFGGGGLASELFLGQQGLTGSWLVTLTWLISKRSVSVRLQCIDERCQGAHLSLVCFSGISLITVSFLLLVWLFYFSVSQDGTPCFMSSESQVSLSSECWCQVSARSALQLSVPSRFTARVTCHSQHTRTHHQPY